MESRPGTAVVNSPPNNLPDVALAICETSRRIDIPDGHAGITVRRGKIGRRLEPGRHWLSPLEKAYIVSLRSQVHPAIGRGRTSKRYHVATRDGHRVELEAALHYHVSNPEPFLTNVLLENDLVSQGSGHVADHVGRLLGTRFEGILQSRISQLTMDTVFSDARVGPAELEEMNRTMARFGLAVDHFDIEMMAFPAEYNDTVLRIIEQSAHQRFMEQLSNLVEGDKNALAELMYIFSNQGDKVAQKIDQRRKAEADAEGFQRLEAKVGPERAYQLRRLEAMSKGKTINRTEDFE